MRIDYLKTIKEAVSVREAAEFYGLTVNNKGFVSCIFHNERTASLKIYPNGRGFYCFGCGAKGDCIDFVAQLFSITTDDAAAKINADFGLNLPIGQTISESQKRQLSRILYKKRKQREKEEAERQAVNDEYTRAMDFYVFCDYLINTKKPKTLDEELDPLFVFALHHIESASYEVEEAHTRRWLFERNRNNAAVHGRGLYDGKAV